MLPNHIDNNINNIYLLNVEYKKIATKQKKNKKQKTKKRKTLLYKK